MEKEKLRNCPFCGRKVGSTYPWMCYLNESKVWTFHHSCEMSDEESYFCISLCAKTKEEIIDRWNGKAD